MQGAQLSCARVRLVNAGLSRACFFMVIFPVNDRYPQNTLVDTRCVHVESQLSLYPDSNPDWRQTLGQAGGGLHVVLMP